MCLNNPTGKMAQVSVIVVNYNSGNLLATCLSSVYQSPVAQEIIVVDNGSIDHSSDVIKKNRNLSGVKLIRNSRNLGFSSAVNMGVSISTKEYLLILNPDCVIRPHALERMVLILEQNSDAGVVGGLVLDFFGAEQAGCRRRDPNLERSIGKFAKEWIPKIPVPSIDMTHLPLPKSELPVDAISGSFFLVRRRIFDAVGGLDEGYFLHFEDLDFCRKVRESGSLVLFSPRACAFHQKGASGGVTTRKIARYKYLGFKRYFKNYPPDGLLATVLLATLSRIMFCVQLSTSVFQEGKTANRHAHPTIPLPLISSHSQIMVLGGRCDLGEFLLTRLSACGYDIIATSRSPEKCPIIPRVQWINPEFLTNVPVADYPKFSRLFSLLPLWEIQKYSELLTNPDLSSVHVFSSSSILSKASSKVPTEKSLVRALVASEDWFLKQMKKSRVAGKVLRPTMIYGGRYNRNINKIKAIAKYLRIFPLVDEATGQRQPVHADDIAEFCITALREPKSEDFSEPALISGGEVLDFSQMISQVIHHTSGQPRLINAPAELLRFALRLLSYLPGQKNMTAAIVDRTQQNLVYPDEIHLPPRLFSPRRFYP
ncbi:MAG: hypothetical protein CME16_05300 [Gemmatimonadetes bacterium]|nr:hypothetical protein [Gemmatimonadota bacterium]